MSDEEGNVDEKSQGHEVEKYQGHEVDEKSQGREVDEYKIYKISGTRGQSRYHYYGLAVKETSPYYDPGKICNDLKKEPDGNISFQPTLERRPQSKPGGPFYIMLSHF